MIMHDEDWKNPLFTRAWLIYVCLFQPVSSKKRRLNDDNVPETPKSSDKIKLTKVS